MPDKAPVILAVDGPPGAGKTSLLARLAPAYGDACVFFTEPNARLAAAPADNSTASHTLWFLRHEQAKTRQIAACARDPRTPLIVCDRNHLGVLAFCHATRAEDSLPYQQALAFHQRHIAPSLPEDMLTVILLVSTRVSLERRGGTAERPLWRQWFSPDLLQRLREFYTDVAPDLCPAPPLVIDTDTADADAVARQVGQLLPPPGTAAPAGTGDTAPVPVDPMFARLYAEAGGLEALGHPLTAPFPYRDGLVQLCQLGALHRDGAGQARLWDPASLPDMAARQ